MNGLLLSTFRLGAPVAAELSYLKILGFILVCTVVAGGLLALYLVVREKIKKKK